MKNIAPSMAISELASAEPAMFVATHVYRPTSSESAAEIVKYNPEVLSVLPPFLHDTVGVGFPVAGHVSDIFTPERVRMEDPIVAARGSALYQTIGSESDTIKGSIVAVEKKKILW